MSNKYSYSLGFIDGLLLLFIGLKLAGVIAWSWWWVFAPVWIPLLVLSVVLGIIACIGTLIGVFS